MGKWDWIVKDVERQIKAARIYSGKTCPSCHEGSMWDNGSIRYDAGTKHAFNAYFWKCDHCGYIQSN
ncbi:MAG: hypothetical protein US70_C0020G0012 [Parcubacteria group bacterium GW2011_GWD2_38_11]|nr:MAG: hypothetical protein US70_C0020G0012 [Parcubacteria group bacterium GW2011_GWD2_38_11]